MTTSNQTDTPHSWLNSELVPLLEKRAGWSTLSAIGIGVLIIALLCSSAYIFFFAERIAQRSERVALVLELQQERENLLATKSLMQSVLSGLKEEERVGQRTINDVLVAKKNLFEIQHRIMVLNAKEQLMKSQRYFQDLSALVAKEELEASLKHYQSFLAVLTKFHTKTKERYTVGEVTKTDVDQVGRYVEAVKGKVVSLKSLIGRAPQARDVVVSKGQIDLYETISTNLIRFGGLAVVLFLVSILVPIYRYNMRLASFYLARADAIKFFKPDNTKEFIELTKVLTPEHEFEAIPTTPTDRLADIINAGLGVVKK